MLFDEFATLEEGDIVEINGMSFEVDVSDNGLAYAHNTEDHRHELCIDVRTNSEINIQEITP